MKVVIDIDDKLYNRIKCLEPRGNAILDELIKSVQNGISLPKGYGDLIDRNEAEKIVGEMFEHITSPLLNHIQTYDVYSLLEATPTVIEADTESEVEK